MISPVKKLLLIALPAIINTAVASAQQLAFADSAQLFKPGLVSTKNADVKITFSPDGKKMLWGGIDWIADKKDFDIWESELVNNRWTKPQQVSFDSDSNDFDPFFAPDGKGVYFFSNRPGGHGGDDIWFAPFNKRTKAYSKPVNLGSHINTPGNEWAPITNATGKQLIFSSNGHGGFGGQDLFIADILPAGFGKPINLGPNINGPGDDFDAALLPNGTLIFTSAKNQDAIASLFAAIKINNVYQHPVKLPVQINAAEYWTFGPSINAKEPGYLYFSSHLPNAMGRTDIYRVKYTVTAGQTH